MANPYEIEEENVRMRQALERVAFMAVGASCKDARCMHHSCSVVRAIESNLTEFMKEKRPNEVRGYQEEITRLRNKILNIINIARE